MKLENNWRNKTLEALEKQDWGNANEAPTNLVRRCILLSKVPVSGFSVEDLRLMIGQQFGLPYLIPLAIERLSENVFVAGNLYSGDLLDSVLRVEPQFWKVNKDLWKAIDILINNNRVEIEDDGLFLNRFYSVNNL